MAGHSAAGIPSSRIARLDAARWRRRPAQSEARRAAAPGSAVETVRGVAGRSCARSAACRARSRALARRLDARRRRARRRGRDRRRSWRRRGRCRSPPRSISSVWLSSSTAKRAGTLASNGTRWSSRSQKAWMVSIFSPPGVSTARAKSVRASAQPRAARALAFEGRRAPPTRAVVVEGHPAAEPLEHPDRHVGGGRLGEGEAQDAPGRRARRAAGAPRGR